jgi:hypothetical protein
VGKNIAGMLDLYGHFSIDHYRNGELIDHREIDNVITNAGKAIVSGLMLVDVGGTAFDYIAIGEGTAAAAATDTALGSEIASGGGERGTGTGTRTTTTTTNDTAQLVKTFTFTSSFAVTETGIFNASSGPTLLARQVFAAVNVASGDTLTITWKIQLT